MSEPQSLPPPTEHAAPPPKPVAHGTSRRRLWTDRLARWIVSGGGMAIIASILGILVFIVIEIVPLLGGAEIDRAGVVELDPAAVGAVVTDEHRTHAAMLTVDGSMRIVELDSGKEVSDEPVVPDGAAIDTILPVPGTQLLSGSTTDGKIVAVPIDWKVTFDDDRRVVEPAVGDTVTFEVDPEGARVGAWAVRLDDEGAGLAVASLADGTLSFVSREVTVNFLTEETTEDWSREVVEAPGRLSAMVLDDDRRNLFAGTPEGDLLWWPISAGRPGEVQRAKGHGSPVTTLTLLIGGRSLVVGHEDGTIAVWFPVRQDNESFVLTRIRDFPALPGAVRVIAPSLRDKGFLAQDETGRLGLYYSTSRRVLWTGDSPLPGATAMFYTPKADGAVLAGEGQLASLDVHNPHPEVSLGALFGKVWYESYEKPAYVWQSTGGTDDFEPKLSMMPLLVGTLKGTLYSLLLAIPLGVLGAMYTSQFIHPTLRRTIKPTVEIMAALPSVVLGFLAGLWLAPRVEQLLPALFLMLIVGPVAVVLTGFAWSALPAALRRRLRAGSELLAYVVVVGITIVVCIRLGQAFEATVFGGDVQGWLLTVTGLEYDQRNAVVVGLAMGFAVIPIIFSIAEDAFSNVPRSLISGSLALGANRWETVTRIVLPTASPGIFSAIMIGFGRAIGETMIVLMATGNTPIMDWNPFNGFRTLSANIAVEIPEAPHGATLYRTLFLAALLLFTFTFAVNTVGDLVRQRLRKRYAEL